MAFVFVCVSVIVIVWWLVLVVVGAGAAERGGEGKRGGGGGRSPSLHSPRGEGRGGRACVGGGWINGGKRFCGVRKDVGHVIYITTISSPSGTRCSNGGPGEGGRGGSGRGVGRECVNPGFDRPSSGSGDICGNKDGLCGVRGS